MAGNSNAKEHDGSFGMSFSWHYWDEDTDTVSVEFGNWNHGMFSIAETGNYCQQYMLRYERSLEYNSRINKFNPKYGAIDITDYRIGDVEIEDYLIEALEQKIKADKNIVLMHEEVNIKGMLHLWAMRYTLTKINHKLLIWAECSNTYRKIMGDADPNSNILLKALGPNETNRYVASKKLMKLIWDRRPELGIGPDYELLAEREFNREFYDRYRDHLTHMFKVFLLGLYLYDNNKLIHEGILNKYNEDKFLAIWILAALYHDIGYLIENREGTRDGELTIEAIEQLNSRLAQPLSKLYPASFIKAEEIVFQNMKRKECFPQKLIDMNYLEDQLESFKGVGKTISLSVSEEDNPIASYYHFLPQRREGRAYYDHGIVSACILLYTQETICDYIKRFNESAHGSLSNDQQEDIDTFLASSGFYEECAFEASVALASHNITQKWDENEKIELYKKGVRIDYFTLSLSEVPIAYLLRVCDELQCWDRQRFDSPKDYSFDGDKLDMTIDEDDQMVKLYLYDGQEREKLKQALGGVFTPPIESFLEIL